MIEVQFTPQLQEVTMDKQQGNDSMAQWVTVRQAADLIGISTQRIRLLLQEGGMDGIKIGYSWLVRRESAEAYKANRKKQKE